MILYRIGEVIYKNNSNIIFESGGVGYSLIMPQHERIEPKQKIKLYLFEIKNDYYNATYAFKEFKERLLFIDLISLSGVGPRVAFNMLNVGWEKIASMLVLGDLDGLVKTPYLNPKVARLAVAELSDKWSKMINNKKAQEISKTSNVLDEAKTTLKTLGFQPKQIDQALNNVPLSNDVEVIIQQAMYELTGKQLENEAPTFTTQ
ncbi:Holliday junction branch migration protein RuvA [Mycoplasma sp. ES3157-GEN-MYC]|uniref:Holliday junction branch migration complex subunit RuvA n=1 Tax=Mycoplasma miroungigenitalium TaxID=754515 RepID=A0A6M4JAB0_9MOLU|nr:Holliday junction branch migration protein RuvA [Mycoplasma miroungigenitalium]MBU4690233.1 Holliday junction branch migration protein RuvA [Mycoplasma miroungigenitalium]MBU4691500.1 Holliday junction branch migration protein RuvA [Mycoplasma miroungigenitalium]QJR43335.1 Holliday junction branch migration protein RuvA [Mycoplasma miroungigenitalium]